MRREKIVTTVKIVTYLPLRDGETPTTAEDQAYRFEATEKEYGFGEALEDMITDDSEVTRTIEVSVETVPGDPHADTGIGERDGGSSDDHHSP